MSEADSPLFMCKAQWPVGFQAEKCACNISQIQNFPSATMSLKVKLMICWSDEFKGQGYLSPKRGLGGPVHSGHIEMRLKSQPFENSILMVCIKNKTKLSGQDNLWESPEYGSVNTAASCVVFYNKK